MSVEKTDNDAKQAGSYIVEKARIAMSRISHDEVVRAVMKVSSHKLKLPNEKHLLRLLQATYGQFNAGKTQYDNVNEFIVTELEKRTHVHDWIPVLKTFIVFHRLMHNGSDKMNEELHKNRRIFCGSYIKDLADTPDGAAQQRIILQYSRYLEERLFAERNLGFQCRMETEEFTAIFGSITDLKVLSEKMEALFLQLEALIDVEYTDAIVSNEATLQVFENLIEDAKRIYVLLTDRIKVFLDAFDRCELSDMKHCLAIYKRYHDDVTKLAHYFQAMRRGDRHFNATIPDMHPLPDQLLENMECTILEGSMKVRRLSGSGIGRSTSRSASPPLIPTTAGSTSPPSAGGVKGAAPMPEPSRPPPQYTPAATTAISTPTPTGPPPTYTPSAAPPSATPNVDLFFSKEPAPVPETPVQPPTRGASPTVAPPRAQTLPVGHQAEPPLAKGQQRLSDLFSPMQVSAPPHDPAPPSLDLFAAADANEQSTRSTGSSNTATPIPGPSPTTAAPQAPSQHVAPVAPEPALAGHGKQDSFMTFLQSEPSGSRQTAPPTTAPPPQQQTEFDPFADQPPVQAPQPRTNVTTDFFAQPASTAHNLPRGSGPHSQPHNPRSTYTAPQVDPITGKQRAW